MLFILTGAIQIGKTRWLQRLVAQLEERGVPSYGVIAPGQWVAHEDGADGVSYEKLGINNELLPDHAIVPFARRLDLAQGANTRCTQSSEAQLAWAIDDDAIERVNAHLAHMAPTQEKPRPGLLVIDELGRLELLKEGGLIEALRLLDAGATNALPHALVVVREQLLPIALERFAHAPWGEVRPLAPSDESAREILAAFDADPANPADSADPANPADSDDSASSTESTAKLR